MADITITNYPLYYINNLGYVFSIRSKKYLTPQNQGGYLSVTLYNDDGRKNHKIHVLVATHFIGNRPQGKEIRHLDGNVLNNNVENLAYGSRLENQQDRIKHGTHNRGVLSGKSKLTNEDVKNIRSCYKTLCITQQELADIFSVSRSVIGHVVRNQSYKENYHF